MTEKHEILIGNKPFMNYVTAVVMQFTTKNADQVVIKSRGKFISKAVDIAEVVKSRFLTDRSEIKDIKIGSEEFQNKEGRTVRVSTFEITLATTKGTPKEKKAKPEAKKEPKPEAEVKAEPTPEPTAKPSTETPTETLEQPTPAV